ncbi:uncharacterized protein angptl8 isoform X2 [Stigmatopora argus]
MFDQFIQYTSNIRLTSFSPALSPGEKRSQMLNCVLYSLSKMSKLCPCLPILLGGEISPLKQKLTLPRVRVRVQSNRMMWALCLICLAGVPGAVRAGPVKRPGGAAPREEVNVLTFGVIQLGESLNDMHQRTEAKVANILRTLKAREDALEQLREQTQQAAEVEKQIKGVILLLQDLTFKQGAETKMTEGQLADMEREEAILRKKVKSLEAQLNSTSPTSIKELQERAAYNASILKGLQHLTQFQKQKIDKHAEQLSTLQKMSESL